MKKACHFVVLTQLCWLLFDDPRQVRTSVSELPQVNRTLSPPNTVSKGRTPHPPKHPLPPLPTPTPTPVSNISRPTYKCSP